MNMICQECNGSGEVIYYVEIARDENTVTMEQRKGICRTCNGSGEKPQTNADRIRSMSDEELAAFLCKKFGCHSETCPGIELCKPNEGKANGILKWLQQPAEPPKEG